MELRSFLENMSNLGRNRNYTIVSLSPSPCKAFFVVFGLVPGFFNLFVFLPATEQKTPSTFEKLSSRFEPLKFQYDDFNC